jgi:hypothetical protein
MSGLKRHSFGTSQLQPVFPSRRAEQSTLPAELLLDFAPFPDELELLDLVDVSPPSPPADDESSQAERAKNAASTATHKKPRPLTHFIPLSPVKIFTTHKPSNVKYGMWNLYRKIHHEARLKPFNFETIPYAIKVFLGHMSSFTQRTEEPVTLSPYPEEKSVVFLLL